MHDEAIYLVMDEFTCRIPIMVVFIAMGMESGKEVTQLLGRDPKYAEMLNPSIEECQTARVFTQEDALEHLNMKIKRKKGVGALDVLRHIFISGVPVSGNNFDLKIVHAVVMLRRLIDTALNKAERDDIDYVGNKMLISVGIFAQVFEDYIELGNAILSSEVDKFLQQGIPLETRKRCKDTKLNEVRFIERLFRKFAKLIEDHFVHCLDVGQCCQPVTSPHSFMTKISMQHKKSNEVRVHKDLHPSEWGMFCPVGEADGLEKNLAPITLVTTHEEETPIISLCYSLGVENMSQISDEEVHPPKSYLVTLNGHILGKHMNPEFARNMRKQRREGRVSAFVSVYVHDKHRWIYIASDAGRVCRPFVIVDEGASKIEDHHIEELKDGTRNFASFLQDGLLGYLDVNELNNAKIALDEENVTNETTHIEIDPYTIFRACPGLIPHPHHEGSPGITTYQEKV